MFNQANLSKFNLGIVGHDELYRKEIETLNQPAEDKIPENIRRLIIAQIHSVEALEILLLLFVQPDEAWTAAEVSRKLCTTVESAAVRLEELKRGRLLLAVGADPVRYRFNSDDQGVAMIVGELEKVYKERRVSVISFIYSKPLEPLRAFSDAFRLRKDDK